VTTNDIFDTDQTFASLGLPPAVLKGRDAAGFVHPTIVQARMLPPAIAGKDVLAQSKTGTGKTAAFGLPILHYVKKDDAFAGLILVPTRELAIQVAHELRELSRFTDLTILPVYGGQRINVQAEKLKKNPQIIVGTPGRVMDMHARGLLPYEQLRVVVLDEVDRMLDIGFREDIRRILGGVRQAHQTIFVSATISPEIEKLAHKYMIKPERLLVHDGASLTVSQVDQSYLMVQPWDKNRLLHHVLKHESPELTLIFCRTKVTVDALVRYLERRGIEAHALHANLHQGKRNSVMRDLRDGKLSVLVASDLASRGIDVDDISHVFNYDIPEDPEIYVHRIGRTARAGKDGLAYSFVTPDQGMLLSNIERLTNVQINEKKYDDFEPGPVPKEIERRATQLEAQREATRVQNSRTTVGPPEDANNADKFPGGIVPKGMPGRRLGGKLRTRRGR
jgi:ATP-dependent RNA helicase DeaD